jgi:sortase (surface protein transpeptidase)
MPAVTSQPDPPAWDVDADWWGPTWDVVTSAGTTEPASGSGQPHEMASVLAEPDIPVSVTSYVAETDPSLVRILAITVRLWVLRRWPGADLAWRRAAAELAWLRWPAAQPRHPAADGPRSPAGQSRHPAADGPRSPAGQSRSPVRRLRVVVWASAVWAAHARLLSAAMLSAGLLAAGAGTVGLVVAHVSSAPAVRLAARPPPVAVPSGRTVLPVSLSTVQQPPRPVWLTIPAIGVKAPIVTLGLNRNGTLQVPGGTTVVGWYTGSPRPGAIGSAIIAGHVDSRSGPGVFFWLRRMHRGERIYVRRADGTLAVFTVTAVQMYAKAQFPTAMVYGPVPDAELRLITCGGTFDYARHSYLSNVVVYARLSG